MNRRKRVAILVGQADEYYQAKFICGFEKQAFSLDWDVCVFSMYQKYQINTGRERGETSIFSMVPYEELDGIVLMLDTLQTPGLADCVEETAHERAKCPVISVDKKSKYFFSVFPNHYEGMKQVVNHLIEEHGYKDIAFLTGKEWHPYSHERMKAYTDAMEEHGLEIKSNRKFYGDFWYTSGEDLGERLAKNKENMPEAVACANDCMAIGLCKALTENGIRVPEDIAVAGYDSTEEGCLSPKAVTSVRLPAEEFGAYTADALKTLAEGGRPEEFSCRGDFFVGGTCGCDGKGDYSSVAKRAEWDTKLSTNSVFSNFNHLDDDLLLQNSLYGLVSTLFTYVYQLRGFESFNLCINDNLNQFGVFASDSGDENKNDIDDKNTSYGWLDPQFLRDPGRFFSVKMRNVMTCRPERFNSNRIDMESFFERDTIIPRLDDDRPSPEAFIITPLHFDNMCFGYAVVSYTSPSSYSENYRLWLRSVMRGLEVLRRQIQLKNENEKLESSLVRDPLTGLYNYKGFTQNEDGLLYRIKGTGEESIRALAVDIKHLAKINDKDGRAAGDKAIIHLGRILQLFFNEGSVFSFGNGEMIVLDSYNESGKKWEESIAEARKELADFSIAQNYSEPVDFYYGYAEGKAEDGSSFEKIASIALANKNAYKVRIKSLSNEQDSVMDSQKQVERISEILDHNRIKYFFQPIVDAHTGDIFAYEALMRADVEPYIPPQTVLKYAELFGRLYDVEEATFKNVLGIIDRRGDEFCEGSKIFINSIPGQHLNLEDLDGIGNVLAVQGNRVVVEFTEEDELSDTELSELKERYGRIGMENAIDDYGTGYSNVSNLLRYMPKYLKIDRSLLAEIHMSPHKQHFVKDIISFCEDNNILSLAEGIETQEELATVIFLGVDLIQGYYTGRPTENIVKEIDPEIKEVILRYNLMDKDDRNNSVYVAGRESKVQLQSLISGDTRKIRVTNGAVTFKDITITGIPGVKSKICLTVDDGYSGRITLENVNYSGKNKPAAIVIGENCNMTLVLKGENFLEDGGILVPESSSLLIEGDGNLNITVNEIESFGIGNNMSSSAGKITFEQDGTIDVSINASKGVCIGAGHGARISIRRGKYFLKMSGNRGVGIGTLIGDAAPFISNCQIDLTSTMMTSVGIGSLEGNVRLKVERTSYISSFDGNEISAIGSIRRGKCNIDMFSVTFQTKFNATSGLMLGPLDVAPSDIKLRYATLRVECTGKQVSVFRGIDTNSKVSVIESNIEGKIESSQRVPLYLDSMEFTREQVGMMVDINGEPVYRNTF